MEKKALIGKLEEEYDALEEKLTKLIDTINSEGFEEKVGETQMSLMLDQESAMRLYLRTLAMRIDDLEDSLEKDEKPEETKAKAAKDDEIEKSKERTKNFAKEVIALLEKYSDKEQ